MIEESRHAFLPLHGKDMPRMQSWPWFARQADGAAPSRGTRRKSREQASARRTLRRGCLNRKPIRMRSKRGQLIQHRKIIHHNFVFIRTVEEEDHLPPRLPRFDAQPPQDTDKPRNNSAAPTGSQGGGQKGAFCAYGRISPQRLLLSMKRVINTMLSGKPSGEHPNER